MSADQDVRFQEYEQWQFQSLETPHCQAQYQQLFPPEQHSKTKKLLKTIKFPKEYDQHVDIKKVNLDVMRKWVTERVTALLGVDDEVIIQYVIEQYESPTEVCGEKTCATKRREWTSPLTTET